MGIVETLKKATEVAQAIGNLELYRDLLDARQALLEQTDEIGRLRDALRARDERDRVEQDLVFEDAAYRRKSEPSGPWYCHACWSGDGKLTPLVTFDGSHRCVRCSKT